MGIWILGCLTGQQPTPRMVGAHKIVVEGRFGANIQFSPVDVAMDMRIVQRRNLVKISDVAVNFEEDFPMPFGASERIAYLVGLARFI
jgi:hypothetical protein